jgi:hypothetical protein
VPRDRPGGPGPTDPLDELLEELEAGLDPVTAAQHDPVAALGAVQSGGLTEGELEAIRVRAVEAIRAADWGDHIEEVGAVTTTPPARESMALRRAADREAWCQVLEAIDHQGS